MKSACAKPYHSGCATLLEYSANVSKKLLSVPSTRKSVLDSAFKLNHLFEEKLKPQKLFFACIYKKDL